jgi:hypothetical protein
VSDNDYDRGADTQKSLREKILAIPPSGLMIDGKINVAECQDIFDHLEKKGIKSCEEKIVYLKEMMSTSGDKYLNEVGVTVDNLNQVVHCVEHRHELLKLVQASTRTLQDIADIRSSILVNLRSAAERLDRDRGIISATGTTRRNQGHFLENRQTSK